MSLGFQILSAIFAATLNYFPLSRKKTLPLLEQVEITDIGAEGKAIARIENMVVFVSGVIPGDVVDLQVKRKRKSYMEAFPVKFHKFSPLRIEPVCPHFGICGGCSWQMLPYEEQLKYKQKQVSDSLQRIGKIEMPEISTIIPSEKTTFYRNKLEFTFSNNRWLTQDEVDSGKTFDDPEALGFHIPGKFDKVLDIKFCALQKDPSNEIRLWVKNYALQHNLPFFDLRSHEGLLRNLIIRTATTGQLMVIVSFAREDKNHREQLLTELEQKFPQITSLMYVINEKANDSLEDQEIIPFKDGDCIFEEIEGLKFKIGPKSFFQTNSEQAFKLYRTARDFANIQPSETVYDLYTGTGTIANFVARQAKKVIGIEYVPEAIEDAKINSKINGIENTAFFAGDLKNVMSLDFISTQGFPDVMIIDPPRAGMHADVVSTILAAEPKRIVYVSCNPATQARDLNLLDEKYKVMKVQPVDMFPHTFHVENVVLLHKK